MKAPFRVPTNTRILLIVNTSSRGIRGSRRIFNLGGRRPPYSGIQCLNSVDADLKAGIKV